MSRIFAVKCYILYEPFKFLTVFGSILIMLLSFAVKVTETPIYSVDHYEITNEAGSLTNKLQKTYLQIVTNEITYKDEWLTGVY